MTTFRKMYGHKSLVIAKLQQIKLWLSRQGTTDYLLDQFPCIIRHQAANQIHNDEYIVLTFEHDADAVAFKLCFDGFEVLDQ